MNNNLKKRAIDFYANDSTSLRREVEYYLNKQIYHQIGYIKSYFDAVTGTDFAVIEGWQKLEEIVDMRNGIIHGSKTTKHGKTVSVTPYEVNQALDFAIDFRDRLEDYFESIGHGRIYDIPDAN